MRNPKEIANILSLKQLEKMGITDEAITKIAEMYLRTNEIVIEFIEEIQKEAYNQALEDAVENAETIMKIEGKYSEQWWYVDEESILKLKK